MFKCYGLSNNMLTFSYRHQGSNCLTLQEVKTIQEANGYPTDIHGWPIHLTQYAFIGGWIVSWKCFS